MCEEDKLLTNQNYIINQLELTGMDTYSTQQQKNFSSIYETFTKFVFRAIK